MKKISILLLAGLLGGQAFSQAEKFDIISYIPPKDWKKDIKESNVSYTNVNEATGGFCILALFASKESAGTAEKDFKNEWNDRLVTPFKADPNPKTETVTEDGWTAITGAAAIKEGDINAYVLLSVFSGFGKVSCILATFNDQSYVAQIDSLLGNLSLDKNAPVAKTTSPETNPAVNTNTGNSIFGIWSTTSVSIANYVTSSGAFVGSADASTMEDYTFNTDHTYKYRFFGSAGGRQYYTETTGTFKIEGRTLTLTPLKRKGGYSGNIQDEKHLLGKAEVYDFYIGPNKWEPGPFLNLHKDGNYYMWSDYPYDYYKRIGDSNNTETKEPDGNNNVALKDPVISSNVPVKKAVVQKKLPPAKPKTSPKPKPVKKAKTTN